jgi:hypothetical protein
MQRGWESETGGSRPGTEMFGGDYSSRPRPYMGCSAWMYGWMDGWIYVGTLYVKIQEPHVLHITKRITSF